MKEKKRPAKLQHVVQEFEIFDVGFGGSGVGRVEGKVWFVPFVWMGEKVRARAVTQKREYVLAELVEVLEPSPHRVSPRCEYFGQCGGCSYQHISYEEQLRQKRLQVLSAVGRIGGMQGLEVRPVVAAPKEYGYRNRITVHIQDGVTGFHRANGAGLLDIRHCEIADGEVNRLLEDFRKKRPFDGHRTLRAGHDAQGGFRQTNDDVAGLLVSHVAELFQGAGGTLVDAYCGSGLFAKFLAPRFSRVIGIDWSLPAIESARKRAGENECYIQGDVTAELEGVLQDLGNERFCVLVDPPSEGLPAEVVALLEGCAAECMVYVSCNPSTFARDLGRLRNSFQAESITPFDMFPQTAQIEIAAFLRRKSEPPVF